MTIAEIEKLRDSILAEYGLVYEAPDYCMEINMKKLEGGHITEDQFRFLIALNVTPIKPFKVDKEFSEQLKKDWGCKE